MAALIVIWTFVKSRVGLPLVVAGCIILFYEGVPIGPLRYIPYVGPALAYLVDGRVDRQYAAGQLVERIAWQKQRDIDIAAREAERKATQAEIDRLTAELQLDAQKRKDEQADADLNKALAAAPGGKQICLPRKVARALNQVGR